METFEIRLQKLEASNRLYKKIILCISSLALLAVFMSFTGNPVADTIKAKKFEVVDDNGYTVVELNNRSHHGAITTYNDGAAKVADVQIGYDDGPSVKLGTGIQLNADQYGGQLYLKNSDGDISSFLGNTEGRGGRLYINNKNGKGIIGMQTTVEGNGDLYVRDNSGSDNLRLSVSASGGNIQALNRSGNKMVEIGVNDYQSGQVNVLNNTGEIVNALTAHR